MLHCFPMIRLVTSRNEFGYDELGRLTHTGINKLDVHLNVSNIEEDFVESPGPGELLNSRIFPDTMRRSIKLLDHLSREYNVEYDTLYRIAKEIESLGNESINKYDSHSNLVRRDLRHIVLDPTSSVRLGERIFSCCRI